MTCEIENYGEDIDGNRGEIQSHYTLEGSDKEEIISQFIDEGLISSWLDFSDTFVFQDITFYMEDLFESDKCNVCKKRAKKGNFITNQVLCTNCYKG